MDDLRKEIADRKPAEFLDADKTADLPYQVLEALIEGDYTQCRKCLCLYRDEDIFDNLCWRCDKEE